MATREAACHCGQLRLEVAGDPFVVSICHCLACQRRTGSAFGMQAAFTPDQVQVVGRFSDFARISDEADRKEHVFHFCPECGSQVFYTEPTEPDLVVVSVGSFADPSFPPPTESSYESRRHPWIGLPDSIQRDDPGVAVWAPVHALWRLASTPRRPTAGANCSRGIPIPGCSTTSPAARASRAGQPTPSSTYDGRSICGRAVAKWRSRTPTSIRSATSARSRN
jgi:hypothetical protein